MSNHNGNANKMVSDTLMNDNAPKREIHRLAIALDGVNKGLEAKFCNGEPILTIHPDGLVTASDRLKPTETAALVLDQIKTRWLNDAQAKLIRELQDRIKRLEGELESTKADRDSWSNQSDEFAKTAADLIIHIKRLEEAGDALKAAGYFGGWADAVNKWNKAKEAKP